MCEGIYTYIIARVAFGCGKNLVQVLAVLRLLRILKPLRKIPYLRETRLLVSALLDSAQKVVHACKRVCRSCRCGHSRCGRRGAPLGRA